MQKQAKTINSLKRVLIILFEFLDPAIPEALMPDIPNIWTKKLPFQLKLICIKSLSYVTKRDLANIRPSPSHDILRPCVIWLLAAYFCNLTWHHFFSLLMAHQYRASSASNAPGFFLCWGLHTCSPKHFANSYRSFRCLHIDHVLRQGFPD